LAPAPPAAAAAPATTGVTGTDVKPVPGDFTGDPVANPGTKLGLAALEEVDEISILCCPDEHYFSSDSDNLLISEALVNQCETTKFRFAVLQAPYNAKPPASHSPSVRSARGYAAYYYPWLRIVNPVTGLTMLIPPGGHIAGIYARSDTTRNVAKDPANEPIAMIDSLQVQITNQQQALLNPVGVNCLRYFKASGNLVWGGRTTSPDPDWKYINVRRLFIFVEKSIQDGTQWVVFEPNDAPLWARVTRSVSDFLTGLWKDGMLQGQTKEQAYFVRCDRTTMTQADIDNGRLIMVIGIAPVKPAEFVIFRIGQWTGGADVTES
jgi:phage tail sheath protein FI